MLHVLFRVCPILVYVWLVRSMSCLSGLCAVCPIWGLYMYVGCLSFFPTSYMMCYAHVLPCTWKKVYADMYMSVYVCMHLFSCRNVVLHA